MGVHSPAKLSKCLWVPSSRGDALNRAVFVGVDANGGNLYVGRAAHEEDLLPCKVAPKHGCAFVAYKGQELRKMQYELLVMDRGHATWAPASDGEVPKGAFALGHTADGEMLYCGRVPHDGTVTPGKVQPSLGACFISYGGEEIAYTEYEVLTIH